MTDQPVQPPGRKPRGARRGLRPALLAVPLLGAVVLAAALLARNTEAVARECVPAQALAAQLDPLARGEVAAMAVHKSPKPAPEVAFEGPQGEALTFADFKGRTILVNLWATWCAPCREEMPALDRLQAELGGEDFEVVAINVDTRNIERPRAWLEEHGIGNLTYYAENGGKLLQALQRSGHVVGLPTTILLGQENCELGILKGPAEWASPDALALVRAALGR